VVRLVVTGGSLARRPKWSLFYPLAEATWQINEQKNLHLLFNNRPFSITDAVKYFGIKIRLKIEGKYLNLSLVMIAALKTQ